MSNRVQVLRLAGLVHHRWRAGRHPHLCAFAVQLDNRPWGGEVVVEQVLLADRLQVAGP